MPTRPCQYCLAMQNDSVFADFGVDEKGCLYLLRISYDGYGCCEPEEQSNLGVIGKESLAMLARTLSTPHRVARGFAIFAQTVLHAERRLTER